MATTISTSTIGPVVLGTADNPLYITSTGTVTSTGSADGIDGGAGTTWTIANAGLVSASAGNGVSLAGSGIVSNTGSISGKEAVVFGAGGSVTNNVGGSISGLGALGAGLGSGAGVFITGAVGTVTNQSTISGNAYGIALGAGGLVTNTSSIVGGEDGVTVHGAAGTIANSGNITATVDDGIGLFAGGSVTNASGATISGQGTLGAGIYITGGVSTVTNAGSISGPNHHGVLMESGGTLSNLASGSISALNTGVFFKIQPGTVINAGHITATGTDGTGVYLENGGSVTNSSTGTIAGNKFGAFLEGAVTTLANYGSISGATYDGVVLGLGGTVTNAAGASISGLRGGVYVKYRAAGTVTNSGSIIASGTGSAGIDLADGGSVTNNSTGSISGDSFGVFVTGAAGAITNSGSITSAKYGGVELVKGGSVINSAGASIKGGSIGVYAGTGGVGTITNSGSISAASASGAGVDFAGGGSITNNSGGSISGGGFGVFTSGVPATLSNSGSISGSHGVGLEAGGSVTNAASASITGQVSGVFAQGGAATLSNAGSISATAGAAADIEGGGSVTNLVGATLSGSTFGVFLTGGSGTVTNTGTISGGADGINFAGSGNVTNNSGGSISGVTFGVLTTNALATVSNSGSISGSKAVGLEAGGSLINVASASISGQIDGVHAQIGAATLSNAGNISATAGAGVDFEAGGSVTNLAGGTLSGSTFGVYLTGGSGTVTNAGTISGGTFAIDFAGSGTNRLVVDPGAVFVGKVTGGTGTNTLELASGTGLISGVGTGSFNNFQVLAVDAGASWTLNGANIAPTILDNGTVSIAGSLDVSTAIDASSTGLFQLGSGATFEVAAATGTTTKINFQDNSGELIIDNAASFGIGVGTASYAGPQLQHFVPGDKIDLKTFSSAGVTLNYNASTGVLQMSNSANQLASLDFQTSSLPPGTTFAATSDGATGIFITDTRPVITVIEALGSTELVQAGSNFFLATISGGSGPELKYAGAAVVAGQFGGWTPIGTEQTAGGYEVAWKITGADAYTVWNTDSSGNYVSNAISVVSGSSAALESLETSFHQDLNGDGVIGLPTTVIEAFGSTELVQVGSNYFMDPVTGGTGPELKINGAAVVAGQSGSWTPIGAEQTAGGYEVAWKIPGADDYTVWNTDSNGNYVSNAVGVVSGTSAALESLETSFHQALNGDVIEAFGSTSLVEVGNNFYLNSISGGSGPELKYAGAAVVAGQFGGWTPIGTEQTAGGYEVAWKITGADAYTVWNTDSSGNYVSNAISVVSGSSAALESLETSFHQDLNGDGVIGLPTTVIEAFGSTELVQVGSNYFMDPVTGGTGPELKINGAAVVAGQSGSWTPIGAEQTAGGYEVAWKISGADDYTVWNTDSNGNYVSNAVGVVSGTSAALESLETSFHQDLNGDGVVFTSGSGSVVGAGNLLIGAGASVELTGAYSGTITFASASGTLTIDHSASFSGTIAGQLATGDKIDLADITAGVNAAIAYSGNNSPGMLTVSDGTHTASMALLGNYSLANFTASSDGHGGTSIIDPPLQQAVSSYVSSGNDFSIHAVAVPDFGSLDHAPPGDPALSPYAKLAGLLDQYMAAGSGQGAPGVVRTALTDSQQASLGGDQSFLTKPHG